MLSSTTTRLAAPVSLLLRQQRQKRSLPQSASRESSRQGLREEMEKIVPTHKHVTQSEHSSRMHRESEVRGKRWVRERDVQRD